MANASNRAQKVSAADYLAAELATSEKHEYVDDNVYAMGGASDRHNIVAGNIFAALHAQSPERCQVFMADMKLRVQLATAECYYYPDILVSCSKDDRALYHREKPILLVEVLSAPTERIDRTERLEAYRQIATLEEYLIASQDGAIVEVYRRATGWQRETFDGSTSLHLASVKLTLDVAAIYRRTGLV